FVYKHQAPSSTEALPVFSLMIHEAMFIVAMPMNVATAPADIVLDTTPVKYSSRYDPSPQNMDSSAAIAGALLLAYTACSIGAIVPDAMPDMPSQMTSLIYYGDTRTSRNARSPIRGTVNMLILMAIFCDESTLNLTMLRLTSNIMKISLAKTVDMEPNIPSVV